MFCRNCGNKLDDDAIFCTKCGSKLTDNLHFNHCIHCGCSLEEDAVFCIKCGNRIKTEEPAIVDDAVNDIENNIEEQQKDALSVNKQTIQIEQRVLPVESKIVEEKSIEEEQNDTKKQKVQSIALQNNSEVFDSDGISNNLTASETVPLSILKKQKKQFRLIFVLTIIFLLSTIGTGVLAYWNYANWTAVFEEKKQLDERIKNLYDKQEEQEKIIYKERRSSSFFEGEYEQLLESNIFVQVTKIYNAANGSTILYHDKITYLEIDYTVAKNSAINGNEKISVRILDPYGRIISPNSFSVNANSSHIRWRTKNSEPYSRGLYKIEFLYKGMFVGRKKFYII